MCDYLWSSFEVNTFKDRNFKWIIIYCHYYSFPEWWYTYMINTMGKKITIFKWMPLGCSPSLHGKVIKHTYETMNIYSLVQFSRLIIVRLSTYFSCLTITNIKLHPIIITLYWWGVQLLCNSIDISVSFTYLTRWQLTKLFQTS